MASARVRAAAAAELAALRAATAPAPALLALRDGLVGSPARKAAHGPLLPAALAEGLQRGWPPEHVAAVLELIADSAPPLALGLLAAALMALLPTHLEPLVARVAALAATDVEGALHVAALLAARTAPHDDAPAVGALVGALVELAQHPATAVLAPALAALVALLGSPAAPPPPSRLAPLWPRLAPLVRSPHSDVQLLAAACIATAGPPADRNRALVALLRLCSHPLRHIRTSAALYAAAAVRGSAASQTFAAVEAGGLLRIDTLLGTGADEELAAALSLLAELCSLSDEARAAAHALRLLPRLLAVALPPAAPPTSSAPAALRCLRLLARGAPFLRSALVEHAVVARALHALPRAGADEQALLLALLANVLLDLAPAKRLFCDAAGPALVAALLAAPRPLPRAALLALRNAAHAADWATKLALLDAVPLPRLAALVRSPHEPEADAALALLRNLVHHDAAQVCAKVGPADLLALAALPSHAHSLPLFVHALYVLCNVAAATEDLRTVLCAHEPSMALLGAGLASAHSPVRVAALWALHNLTWKHPARAALCVERGLAARVTLLRTDPALDVSERARSITWL